MTPPDISRARLRAILRESGPMTVQELCHVLGIMPKNKGSRVRVSSVLSGMCLAEQVRYVTRDGQRCGGVYEYVGEPYPRYREEHGDMDAAVAAYLREHGPSTVLDISDALDLYPHNVRRAMDRLGATAPDEKPKRWRLAE